ncbi:MAG: divergent polysaccharide deacetylase family protein [Candidatus Omnitrophota bacterium]
MKRIIGLILILILAMAVVSVFTPKPRKAMKARPKAIKGKIAIVLDDWGYNLNDLQLSDGLSYPFTAAVLPEATHTGEVSRRLHSRGREIILHLPMEPEVANGLEKNTIMVYMDKDDILRILDRDLANVVYAKGVSNHMGSKATCDAKTMAVIFGELKKRHLFFLDSFVTSKTVCRELARKLKLVSYRRDVFLDNIEEKGYIKKQILILKNKAKAHGFAVGIGHDRQITLEVLKEVMPKLAKEGYEFVFLSELKE